MRSSVYRISLLHTLAFEWTVTVTLTKKNPSLSPFISLVWGRFYSCVFIPAITALCSLRFLNSLSTARQTISHLEKNSTASKNPLTTTAVTGVHISNVKFAKVRCCFICEFISQCSGPALSIKTVIDLPPRLVKIMFSNSRMHLKRIHKNYCISENPNTLEFTKNTSLWSTRFSSTRCLEYSICSQRNT